MLPRSNTVLVDIPVEYDVRFRFQRVGDLSPEERDRTSHLDKRTQHRLVALKTFLETLYYLLDLNPVSHVSLMIYAPSQVSCPCKMSITPCNYHYGKLVAPIHKVLLKYVSLDDWHDPLFAFKSCVELP